MSSINVLNILNAYPLVHTVGQHFTSKTTRLFLCLILVDLAVISAMIFPVVPCSSNTVMFEVSNQSLKANEYDYQWFELTTGDTVRIEILSDTEIEAYLFTEEQFVKYADGQPYSQVDSISGKESGMLSGLAISKGNYFFVISNTNDSPAKLIHTRGTGVVFHRVTLSQIIRERYGTHIPYEPKIVRDKAGVGSFS